jgi:glycosyltransferase involved in cell wall biosynthesis
VTPEAMASGLPVLAFDYAAAAALIRSGHNGVLVPCGDPSEYVRTAVALAASAELRRAIAAQARSTALTLGWDRILDQFESVLDSVMAHGPVRKTRPAAALPRTA